ncbi:MAG: hypothetical protein QXL01_03140 [Thermoplasmatales archaeon]
MTVESIRRINQTRAIRKEEKPKESRIEKGKTKPKRVNKEKSKIDITV